MFLGHMQMYTIMYLYVCVEPSGDKHPTVSRCDIPGWSEVTLEDYQRTILFVYVGNLTVSFCIYGNFSKFGNIFLELLLLSETRIFEMLPVSRVFCYDKCMFSACSCLGWTVNISMQAGFHWSSLGHGPRVKGTQDLVTGVKGSTATPGNFAGLSIMTGSKFKTEMSYSWKNGTKKERS